MSWQLSLAVAALAVLQDSQPPAFPAEARLKQPLGFRTEPSLKAPFVIRGRNYLTAGTRLRLLESDPAFGTEGAFCKAEAQGRQGYIRCDKAEAFELAPATDSSRQTRAPAEKQDEGNHEKLGKYCRDVDSCKAFCRAHCKLDLSRWSSTCKLPGLLGSLAVDSPLLKGLPELRFVKGASGVRATDGVMAGLKRLDEHIAGSSSWPKGHVAFVKNCFRSMVKNATKECDFILKGWHLREKWAGKTPESKAEEKQKADGERFINPAKNLGLSWPGAGPHSAGNACDIVVRDPNGREVTACKSTEKMRPLSRALVDALTNDKVGAVRLNYEGWHFEWGGPTHCRCKGDDCNDNHWPTPCDGGQHCARPR